MSKIITELAMETNGVQNPYTIEYAATLNPYRPCLLMKPSFHSLNQNIITINKQKNIL